MQLLQSQIEATWNCPAGYAGPAQCDGAYTIGSRCGNSKCDCYKCYDPRLLQNNTDSKAMQLLASQTETTWNCPAGYAGPAQCDGAYTIGSHCGNSKCDCYKCYDPRLLQNNTDSKAMQLLQSQTEAMWNCPAGYAGPAQCSGAYTIGSRCGNSKCDCYYCYDPRLLQNSTDSKAMQLLKLQTLMQANTQLQFQEENSSRSFEFPHIMSGR